MFGYGAREAVVRALGGDAGGPGAVRRARSDGRAGRGARAPSRPGLDARRAPAHRGRRASRRREGDLACAGCSPTARMGARRTPEACRGPAPTGRLRRLALDIDPIISPTSDTR